MLDVSDHGAPPSVRRGSQRSELQWGNDFNGFHAAEVEVALVPEAEQGGGCGISLVTAMGPPGSSACATGPKRDSGLKVGSGGLIIDTSPPQLAGHQLFKKRPSPPLTSPSAVKSSLAQKKSKRPAPLMLPDVATETGPSPPSTVVVGPTLSTIELNELALEDIIYEGHTVYGIQSSKGRRRYMEDTSCAYEDINGEGTEVQCPHTTHPLHCRSSGLLCLGILRCVRWPWGA